MRIEHRLIPVIALFCLALTSCAAPSEAPSPSPSAASPEAGGGTAGASYSPSIEASIEFQRQDAQAVLLSIDPDADIPEVETIRAVSFSEIAQVHAACLRARGWEVSVSADGRGIERTILADQRTAIALDEYRCSVEYPMLAEYSGADNAEALYDYYVQELIPCLQAAGHELPEAPSRQSFIEDASWTPYQFLPSLTSSEWAALETACPQQP